MLKQKIAIIMSHPCIADRILAKVFVGYGAQVVLCHLDAPTNQLEKQVPLQEYKIDFSKAIELEKLAKSISQTMGKVDILVNSFDLNQYLPLPLLEESDLEQMLAVNVKAPFIASRSFLKHMIRNKKGALLNISSIAAERIIDTPIHYATSKAAIKGLTMSLAQEVGKYNIRVNAIAPGLIEDGFAQNLPEHRIKDYIENVPLKRMAKYQELAELAAFMVSDLNGFMNGEIVAMDGGL